MISHEPVAAAADAHRNAGERFRSTIPHLTPVVLVVPLVVLAGLVQLVNPGVTDVSWLLTVAERVLAGERLYVDVIEVNPPASVLLYVPAAWLARRLSVAAEHVVIFLVLLGLLLSMWSAGRLLTHGRLLPDRTRAALAAVVAFGLLPGNSFAQREHLALLALLPMLALIACRTASSIRISGWAASAVGFAAGVAVCTKPHFAAAILLPQLYAARRAGSLGPVLHIENWVVGMTVAAYAATAALFFPEYWARVLPLVLETYRPTRVPLGELWELIAPFVVLGALALWSGRKRWRTPSVAVPGLAAAGFLLAYFEQAKGWQYHYYPAVALLVFMILRHAKLPWDSPRPRRPRFYPVLSVVTGIVMTLVAVERFRPYSQISRSLEPTIQRLSERPKVLAISGDLGVGHPLTRRVNGGWVGRVPSQWLSEMAHLLQSKDPHMRPEVRRRLEVLTDLDRSMFVADLRNHEPDVLLIDIRPYTVDWKAWAEADKEFTRLMEFYVLADRNREVELYVRRRSAVHAPSP